MTSPSLEFIRYHDDQLLPNYKQNLFLLLNWPEWTKFFIFMVNEWCTGYGLKLCFSWFSQHE